jgi:hypothetical protein
LSLLRNGLVHVIIYLLYPELNTWAYHIQTDTHFLLLIKHRIGSKSEETLPFLVKESSEDVALQLRPSQLLQSITEHKNAVGLRHTDDVRVYNIAKLKITRQTMYV